MKPLDAQPIVEAALEALASCCLEGPAGRYRSHPHGADQADPWTAAAVINILYTLDRLPSDAERRSQWIEALNGWISRESGMVEAGKDADNLMCTAAVYSALSSLHILPDRRPVPLEELKSPSVLRDALRNLPWCQDPEQAGRELAALFTCMVYSGQATREWREEVLRWIEQEADDHTGLLRRDCLSPVELDGHWTLLPYLCGNLYPLLIFGYCRHPHPLPWRLVDTALEVMEFHRELFFQPKGQRHLPWVYCLTRARNHTAHRFEEVDQALRRFLPPYLRFLEEQIARGQFHSPIHIQWDLATLAELQHHLPGTLHTHTPLMRVLDRHPFL